MKIMVRAKPNSKKTSVERTPDGVFVIAVKEKPEHDRANQAIIKALAGYLDIAPSRVKIVLGRTSKQKVVEIR